MNINDQRVTEKISFNILAQSPYPIRLNGIDVIKTSFDEIVAESDDGEQIVFKRSEIGQMHKPQLSNFSRQFYIGGIWA